MRRLAVALACLVPLGAALPAMAADALPDEVEYTLIYMREEEKLAHDVYLHFDGLYGGKTPGAQVFQHITLSEQRHTDAVAQLLAVYGVADTVADAAPGEFTIPELQDLYVTLIAVGETGLTEALGVGVLIERKDMTDIVEAIEVSVDYADIVQVYTNLLAGSENHLAAFLKALDTSAASTAASSSAAGNDCKGGACGKGH
jgi:hypothetical protein